MDNPITFIRYSASLNRLHFFEDQGHNWPSKNGWSKILALQFDKSKKKNQLIFFSLIEKSLGKTTEGFDFNPINYKLTILKIDTFFYLENRYN